MEYFLPFLAGTLSVLAGKLRERDRDNVGADDAFAELLTELSSAVPSLISGRFDNRLAFVVMFAINRVSGKFLKDNGHKLPKY